MLNWLLILFLTILSSALLGYIAAYKTIIPEAAIYYSVDQNKIVMLSSIISFIYLVLTPLALPWLKQYFSTAVKLSATVIAFGCVNRYILHQNYWASMFLSVLVGIAYIPIITAPYGLLGLFQQKYRAYAASFPIILPSLWVNLVTANGLRYIADTDDEVKSKIHIQKLNIIIAGIAVISAIFIVILMYCLDKQIQKVTEQNKNIQNNTGYIQFFYNQIKDHKQFAVITICWATIFGINWAYSGMYSVFLDGTNLGYPDTLRVSFYANIISFVFSHIFSLVSHKLNFSNNSIIFYINLLGFLASVFLQCSTGFSHPLFHNNRALIVAVIVSRIGFSSFVSLVLVQLSKFGSLILTSSIFFYMANIVNIFSSHFSTILSTSKYLTYMSWIVLICLVLVYFFYPRNKLHFVETQFEFEDISIDKEKQQNRISYIQ